MFHLFSSWVPKNEVVGGFIFASWATNDVQRRLDLTKGEFKPNPKLYFKQIVLLRFVRGLVSALPGWRNCFKFPPFVKRRKTNCYKKVCVGTRLLGLTGLHAASYPAHPLSLGIALWAHWSVSVGRSDTVIVLRGPGIGTDLSLRACFAFFTGDFQSFWSCFSSCSSVLNCKASEYVCDGVSEFISQGIAEVLPSVQCTAIYLPPPLEEVASQCDFCLIAISHSNMKYY